MKKIILFIFTFSLLAINLAAQTEPEFAIALLENDNIAEVNVDQDVFIESLTKVSDLAKEEFADIDPSQKIGLLIISHKEKNPTIELHSNPELSEAKKQEFLAKLKPLATSKTKIVDFPLLILINSKFEEFRSDFEDLVPPAEQRATEYQNASLIEKYELNKSFAQEVLKVLSAYQTKVDAQFVGVRNMGTLFAKTDFSKEQDISTLIDENAGYWRATLEMNVGNQLFPISKIFALTSQGEFDYAIKYIEMIQIVSDPKSVANGYMAELKDRLDGFNSEISDRIKAGIAHHDGGKYQKAIDTYKEILSEYPNSAWTKYELYYSTNAMNSKDMEVGDRSYWDEAKVGIYKSNPLYNMDVRASNGREAYLLFRRLSISELFKDPNKRLSDIYEYADIALDLGVYDFAAQLYWISATYDKADNNALNKFLYCLEKLGVTDLKSNFKGDFDKEFSKIEKEMEKKMLKSDTFKSFKK